MFEENNHTQQNEYEPPVQNQYQYNYVPYGFTPETYAEKRDLRKRALVIGIPSVCLFLITFLWSFIYLFFTVKIIGLSYTDAVKLAGNSAFQQIMQIILSILMFLLPFPIAAKIAGYRIDGLISFEKPKKNVFLPLICLGVGFCSFANIAMNYASQLFESFGIEYEVNYAENPTGVFGFLLTFIATAIVPALVEEFACRGIVLGLLKKYGEGFAIITSSVVFGVMHGNFEQIPFAITVGLILGYVYVKTGSIWASAIIHCVNNSVSVIFSYLSNSVSTSTQNLLYIIYLSVSLFAAILGIYIFAKKGVSNPDGENGFELKKADNVTTAKQKYGWFFTSWAIIVFLAVNLLESLTYFVI